ncbi:helix-turn-helix domain-containing protein [Brotaphodocola sp.]|uniref:helix-turn-helix domain-containing protein n=1 Tax=Brotaphodocola sp. TaxID=3073577 RepID=UPI003D7D4D91
MEPIYMSIQQEETGNRIRALLKKNGYTVKDIQGAMGFENPQAIYKWLSGKTLPSLDNLLILSRVLHTTMEDILVIDGDISFYSVNVYHHAYRGGISEMPIGLLRAKSASLRRLLIYFEYLQTHREPHYQGEGRQNTYDKELLAV